jgi:poly-gamma-glutamate synthesis protein (capsule biosynthesis protein)
MKKAGIALAAGATVILCAYVAPSYIYAPEAAYRPATSVRVLFAGDMMLDRNVARSAQAKGTHALFADDLRALFAAADLRVLNLEGTITGNRSIAQQNNKILRFTFDPAAAKEVLQDLDIQAVSLANNHALDFYAEGYEQTRAEVEGIGIQPFGHPLNAAGTLSAVVEAKGKNVCMVGYHSLFDADITEVVSEIQALRPSCWRVAVMPHWGEEYITHSHAGQQEAAHAFIEAGADLVVGSHPHVVQEVEVYKERAIFYSLGNFMFDQNFSWGTTHGLVVVVDFGPDKTSFSLIPTTIIDQHAALAGGEDRAKILELAGVSRAIGGGSPAGGQVAEFSLP